MQLQNTRTGADRTWAVSAPVGMPHVPGHLSDVVWRLPEQLGRWATQGGDFEKKVREPVYSVVSKRFSRLGSVLCVRARVCVVLVDRYGKLASYKYLARNVMYFVRPKCVWDHPSVPMYGEEYIVFEIVFHHRR